MSIHSLCDRFTATLKRQISTENDDGTTTQKWVVSERVACNLPESVRCDMQTLTASDRIEFGIKDDDLYWCMYTASNPFLDGKDVVEWTDTGGIARTCRVFQPSFDMAGRGRIWKTVVRELAAWA